VFYLSRFCGPEMRKWGELFSDSSLRILQVLPNMLLLRVLRALGCARGEIGLVTDQHSVINLSPSVDTPFDLDSCQDLMMSDPRCAAQQLITLRAS